MAKISHQSPSGPKGWGVGDENNGIDVRIVADDKVRLTVFVNGRGFNNRLGATELDVLVDELSGEPRSASGRAWQYTMDGTSLALVRDGTQTYFEASRDGQVAQWDLHDPDTLMATLRAVC